ncbi:hypothetical protein HanLR1_Chr09g0303571 [Helianthus annuus]|nr:hypothetical protein HanHA89_Chr09g0324021 [Helianthus annuus]KAJ0706133.1 hypothetical protein HanLR1_Chr09g0303571 [Helianthus annuus]
MSCLSSFDVCLMYLTTYVCLEQTNKQIFDKQLGLKSFNHLLVFFGVWFVHLVTPQPGTG